MKQFLFIIPFCLFFYCTEAQPKMLGKDGAYIKFINSLPAGIGIFDKQGVNTDSTTYLQFIAKKDYNTTFRYYLNKEGICHFFVIMQPTSQMVSFIMSLNESYIKIGDDEWISKSHDLSIRLTYLKGASVFTTGFSRIE